MGAATHPALTMHDRPAEGEAHELVGFEHVLNWLRIVGVAVMVTQAPAYRLLDPLIVVLVAVVALGTAVVGHLAVREDLSLPEIRRRGALLLGCDVAAIYLMGTAFVPDPHWLGFYFYPLISLEATLIGGTAAGLAVTGLSLVVYGAQAVLHVSFGNALEVREAIGAAALIGMTGGFVSVFGLLAERGRRDLRVLLDLTRALALREPEPDTISLLDQRLHDAVGGRVRSIVLRAEDGGYEIVRWRSRERRRLSRADLEASLGSSVALAPTFEAGSSMTLPTDAWSAVTSALGLPEWSRSVTLVPIFGDGRWVGILPVLWPVARVPDRHELRLLYGLAGHLGLAVAQGELRGTRAEDPEPEEASA
jgi:hypothetical protein